MATPLFIPLTEHRTQRTRTVNGVEFIDDAATELRQFGCHFKAIYQKFNHFQAIYTDIRQWKHFI